MSAQTIIILILIGLAAGMLSGLVGVGGGIIIVPSLIYFLGLTQKEAQGTSLGILLLPVGILAVMQYYRQGFIDLHYILIIALSFVVGGLLGSKIATTQLNDEKLKKIFAIIMMLASLKMLFFDVKHKNQETEQQKSGILKSGSSTDDIH